MAIKTISRLFTVGIIGAGLLGCFPSAHETLLEQSGVAATDLAEECKLLVSDNVRTGKDTWLLIGVKAEPFPEKLTTILKLSPQFVHIRTSDEATVVDIQISGGFNHRGLLVVCDKRRAIFIPVTGAHWKTKKIAPDIYEYRE
jgi:hypothetical protein